MKIDNYCLDFQHLPWRVNFILFTNYHIQRNDLDILIKYQIQPYAYLDLFVIYEQSQPLLIDGIIQIYRKDK